MEKHLICPYRSVGGGACFWQNS